MTERARVSKIGVANPTPSLAALVDADLDTLVTALYVKIDDVLEKDRRPGPPRPAQPVGVLPGGRAGAAGLPQRAPVDPLRHLPPARRFPLPAASARLQQAAARRAAADQAGPIQGLSPPTATSGPGNVWVADSTPVECGRSRPAVKRSDVAGWATPGTARAIPDGSGGCGCT